MTVAGIHHVSFTVADLDTAPYGPPGGLEAEPHTARDGERRETAG